MWTQLTWKYFTKNVEIRLIFQSLSLISPTFYVACLQPYAWLESYDRYGSFGTMLWGSLIICPVVWLLSSRNTLSVTDSDTASYSSHQNWNATKPEMSPKLKYTLNWNVTKTEMSLKLKCPQNKISPELKCHQSWYATQIEMSHWNVTNTEMLL